MELAPSARVECVSQFNSLDLLVGRHPVCGSGELLTGPLGISMFSACVAPTVQGHMDYNTVPLAGVAFS